MDLINISDVIARFEELEQESLCLSGDAQWIHDNLTEYESLKRLLEDVKGVGEMTWRGVQYPDALINDSYFPVYARELAKSLGLTNPAVTWPCNCIDWDLATAELKKSYTSLIYKGETYWIR